MKKTIVFILVLIACHMIQTPGLFAQGTDTALTQRDPKTQEKTDKARAELDRDQQQLIKDEEKHNKDMAEFEKDEQKGKLSPDEILKEKKRFEKAEKDLEKLRKRIADTEALLKSFE